MGNPWISTAIHTLSGGTNCPDMIYHISIPDHPRSERKEHLPDFFPPHYLGWVEAIVAG